MFNISGLICVLYSSHIGSVRCWELMSGSVKPGSLQPSGRSHPEIMEKQCTNWELNKSFCVCSSVTCTRCQMKHCCLSSICPELSLILERQFDPFSSLFPLSPTTQFYQKLETHLISWYKFSLVFCRCLQVSAWWGMLPDVFNVPVKGFTF